MAAEAFGSKRNVWNEYCSRLTLLCLIRFSSPFIWHSIDTNLRTMDGRVGGEVTRRGQTETETEKEREAFKCHICLELLFEPVTLPCTRGLGLRHEMCSGCYAKTVAANGFNCPFCRGWFSSWSRTATKRNSLVNLEKWDQIQAKYPEKVSQRRHSIDAEQGDEEGEQLDDGYQEMEKINVFRTISEPGEVGNDFKEEAEKFRREEEERAFKASEEVINKILKEEEKRLEVERQLHLKRLKEMTANDEEMALKVFNELNGPIDPSSTASSSSTSPDEATDADRRLAIELHKRFNEEAKETRREDYELRATKRRGKK